MSMQTPFTAEIPEETRRLVEPLLASVCLDPKLASVPENGFSGLSSSTESESDLSHYRTPTQLDFGVKYDIM